MLDVVTRSSGVPNISGINEVVLRGRRPPVNQYHHSNNGRERQWRRFVSLAGNRLSFTPAGFIDAPRLNPANSSFYERIYVRYSDGTNASPLTLNRVIALMPDQNPASSDGMPDDWMTAYFGTTSPVGNNRGANADFDGDGFTNLREFILGSDPTSAASNLRITSVGAGMFSFQAKPYELYEVHGSTNLTTWRRVTNPILPTTAVAVATGYINAAGAYQFLRVLKVP